MNLRIKGLDCLRAVAIVWVMLFHSWVVGGLGRWDALATPGWVGVDLFFVLSGFLIGGQVFARLAQHRFSFREFYARRAARILPAYLVVLAIYALWPAAREAKGLAPLWALLTFTVNLVIDYARAKAFSHAWSLCVEEHFYLLFPLIALLAWSRLRLRGTVALVIAIVVVGLLLRAAVWQNVLAPLQADGPFGTRWVETIYYPTWMRLDGLVLGVALAAFRIARPEAWSRLLQRDGRIALGGLVVLALGLVVSDERYSFDASVWGFPLVSLGFALLVASGSRQDGLLSRLTPRGASWLAAVSYSLYLVHKAVFVVVDEALPEAVPGAARFVAIAIASIAAGAFLHYAVERPALRWGRRPAQIVLAGAVEPA